MDRAAILPSCTADTVRSLPPWTQSPPAHTPGQRSPSFRVDRDSILAQLDDLRCLGVTIPQQFLSDRLEHDVGVEHVRLPCSFELPVVPDPGRLELDGADPAIRGQELAWPRPISHRHATDLRELLLVAAGIHVLLAAAVDHGHLFRAQSFALDRDVDRGHAATDHDDSAADRQ